MIEREEDRAEAANLTGSVPQADQQGIAGSQSGARRETFFNPRSAGRLAFVLALFAMAAGALALRTVRLAERPMHTDEAVHAIKLGELLEHGTYHYNPREYHGPTLYYFTLPLLWLGGVRHIAQIPNEIPLRRVPALFGAGLILLLFLVADGLGRRVTLAAAALTALSPAMVFYSRYYIQEIVLVFFTFAAIAVAWRYTRKKHFAWALAGGLALGLMHATKETSVIALASMSGAALLAALWRRRMDGIDCHVRWHLRRWHLLGTIAVAALVAILFLTGFLTNWGATLDTVRTSAVYLERAGSGDGSTNGLAAHNHPWNYYLGLLAWHHHGAGPVWSEALILALAVVGLAVALRPRAVVPGASINLLRFLAFYTILMTAIYSAIPYKTPWCLLSFLHGMILLAGVGVAALWRAVPRWWWRAAVGVALVAGGWNLGAQAWRGTTARFDADPRNPYVYGHTAHDLLKLVERAGALARLSPEGHSMVIKVFVPGADYWPLPWYLRDFNPDRVGYWNEVPSGASLDASLIITRPELLEAVQARVKDRYGVDQYYGLRPEVLLAVMIRQDLWDRFLAAQEARTQ